MTTRTSRIEFAPVRVVATFVAAVLATLALLLSACAPMPPQVPPTEPPQGLMDVAARPAEKALLAGLRAYEDGQYAESEKQLQRALGLGLVSPRDKAAAHKHLAFIYCTSSRLEACEGAFRSARAADPAFALTRSETGHPLWGPVYRKLSP